MPQETCRFLVGITGEETSYNQAEYGHDEWMVDRHTDDRETEKGNQLMRIKNQQKRRRIKCLGYLVLFHF